MNLMDVAQPSSKAAKPKIGNPRIESNSKLQWARLKTNLFNVNPVT